MQTTVIEKNNLASYEIRLSNGKYKSYPVKIRYFPHAKKLKPVFRVQ